MCLRRAPEKYIAGAALDRAALAFSRQVALNLRYRYPQGYTNTS
jgi:hypothetical protein